jgi:hypothetical protein
VSNRQTKNQIFLIASDVLTAGGGFPLIEEACDLVVADCRLNDWLASTKQSKTTILTKEDWLQILEEMESIRGQLQSAWQAFRSYDWPRGEFDAWSRYSAVFQAALRKAKREIDTLGRCRADRISE